MCISEMEIPTFKLKCFHHQPQEEAKSCTSIESDLSGKSEDASGQVGRLMLQITQVRLLDLFLCFKEHLALKFAY